MYIDGNEEDADDKDDGYNTDHDNYYDDARQRRIQRYTTPCAHHYF